MGYRFEKTESANAGVRRIVGEQIDAALGELFAEQLDVPTRVHQVRKRIKKTRAGLRLIRPCLGSAYGPENDRLRDAARQLSLLRDTQARREALDRLCARFGRRCPAAAVERVGRLLAEVQGEDAPALAPVLEQVANELRQARAEQSQWALEGNGFGMLGPGLKWTYGAGRRALARALKKPSVERLHEWRKRVKDYWYHCRVLRPVWPAITDPYCAELKALSEQLGDDHDLALLYGLLDVEPRRFGGVQALAPLTALIDERRLELQVDTFSLGRRIFAERPKAFVRRMAAYWDAWHAPAEAARGQSTRGPEYSGV